MYLRRHTELRVFINHGTNRPSMCPASHAQYTPTPTLTAATPALTSTDTNTRRANAAPEAEDMRGAGQSKALCGAGRSGICLSLVQRLRLARLK